MQESKYIKEFLNAYGVKNAPILWIATLAIHNIKNRNYVPTIRQTNATINAYNSTTNKTTKAALKRLLDAEAALWEK